MPTLLQSGWTVNSNGQLPRQYLGEPWSEVTIGRVMIGGNEKWVGFIGGGYDGVVAQPRARMLIKEVKRLLFLT